MIREKNVVSDIDVAMNLAKEVWVCNQLIMNDCYE